MSKYTSSKPNKTEQPKETWNDFRGMMRIYGNLFDQGKDTERMSWSVSLGSKRDDGSFSNYYLRIRFAHGAQEPTSDGLHMIDIRKAFLTFDEWTPKGSKETVQRLCLVVQDNEIVD